MTPTLIAEAHRRLLQWADERGFQVDENRQRQLQLQRAAQHITIETEAIDVARFTVREHGRRAWDLLIGQAFLDLIDMPATLPALCSLVRPGGLLYFPLTFDGGTVFQRVLEGKPSGDSRAGRRLFAHLRTAGCSSRANVWTSRANLAWLMSVT